MKMRSVIGVGIFAVLTVGSAFGFTKDKVPEKSYANVLTINVESGTQTIGDALAAKSLDLTALTGNVYDKLEKTGTGKLTLDQDISAFTGDIYVEGGYLSATDPTSLGAESGEDTSFIVVREGAQLDYISKTQGQWSSNKKTVYLAGTGPEGGNGYAMQFSGSGSVNPQSGTCGWGKNLILTGDATLGRVAVSWPDMWSAAGIYFNGHRLTMDFGTTANRFRFYGKDSNPDSSAYIKSSGEVYMKLFGPAGSADNKLIIGEHVGSIRMQCNPSVWTWIVENGDTTRFLIDKDGKQLLSPLVIQQGNLLVTNNLETYSAYTFADAISGAGGLRVSPIPAETPFELTLGAVNTFAGALTVENATLHANVCGAVPPEAPLVLSDATADLKIDAVLRLGAVTASGDNLIELSRYPAVVSGLSVRDGTTRFSTTDRVPTIHTETGEIAPGLFCSRDDSVDYWKNGLDWSGNQVVTEPAHTNDIDNIVLSLDYANVYSTRTVNGYYCYSGYIMNMTDKDVTWGFYVHPHARGYLEINGSSVSGRTTATAKYAKATLKPGANTFLFKCVEADKRCGPYYGTGGIDPLGGFAICKTDDAASKTVATLTADDLVLSPTDPGDGSLFRVANSAEEIAALGIKERKITVTDLSVASGAALNVGGRELIVTNLTGSGAIGNYNRLTVVGTLTGGTGATAAGALTLAGGIVFAEGAKVVLDTTGMRSSTAYPLVSAATPIVGTPTLELTGPRADIGGTLQFSENRTSLTFVPEQQGVLILVR